MVLLLPDGSPLTETTGARLQGILERNKCIKDTKTQFLSSDGGHDDCKYIHVEQGECAHVNLHNEPDSGVHLLSHAATTCVICVLHCATRHQAFIAHIDGSSSSDIAEVVAALDVMHHPEVLLVGAYEGGSGCGEVLPGLLQQLQRHAIHCRVRLFCCGALNTSADGQPLAQGLSYHTGVCTCHCPPPGSPPGTPRRQALWWAGALCGRPQRGLQQVYDSAAATLVLPGTHLRWPWYAISHAAMMVKKSDEEILRTCSTSPDAEMPGFAAGVRAKLQWCIDNLRDDVLELKSEKLYFSHGQGWLPSTPTT